MGPMYPFCKAVAIGGLAPAGPDVDVVGLRGLGGFRVLLGRAGTGLSLAAVALACVVALLCDL